MNVLFLNSAHSKYPKGNDPWVQATLRAIESIKGNDIYLLCGSEPSPWGLVTYLAGQNDFTITLIIAGKNNESGLNEYNKLLREFALDKHKTVPLFIGESESRSHKKFWPVRDRYALSCADVVYPISLRPGGRLDRLLSEKQFNADIRNDFRIEWTSTRNAEMYDFQNCEINSFPAGEWLVHWTHASPGQWPGEMAWEFYHDMLTYSDIYVRSAEKTLMRILDEGIIRGTESNFPNGETAVSFTALGPEDSVSLMRWRKRFVRYTFEPFGIGIKREVMERLGGKCVRYTDPSSIHGEDRLFVQSPGKKGDWTKEKEWRFRGDFPLNHVARDDVLIIIPDRDYGDSVLAQCGGYNIHILFKD